MIRDTGRVPVERDGLYRTVRRYDEGGERAPCASATPARGGA